MACTSLPVINNGYITASTSERVEYECLAGFKLIGNKVIECDGTNGWPQAPSCQVIKQDFNIIDSSSNLYRFVILVLFLILFIVSVVLCCFCKKWKGATVHPIGGGEEGSTNEKSRDKDEQITRNKRQEFRNLQPRTNATAKTKNTMTPVETNEHGPLSSSGVFVTEESVKIPVEKYDDRDQDRPSSRMDIRVPLTYIHLEDDDEPKSSPTASQKVLRRSNDKFLNEPKTVEIFHHHIHSKNQPEASPERYKRYPNHGDAQWMTSPGSETSRGYKSSTDSSGHNKQVFDSPSNQGFYRSKYYLDEIKNYKKKVEGSKDNPVWRPHVRSTQRY
ncbi:hypothetical protein LOTGIDRAFT_168855 [Lottia gigantea]|uniref:Sushi domain-containing protein n=1 Tax=Lottia gigantea TaxID=225164 RepID=V3ZU13_LOTGI|nr:hypothetical protein LOTGIDRAFT_168855 [Lottia gigantea]ESO84401.1 hypothetical protein LOTGIDRAFT_168855 [Lottia gigantea]